MKCKLCGHSNVHKHGTLPGGAQRYRCPSCQKTFTGIYPTNIWHNSTVEIVQR